MEMCRHSFPDASAPIRPSPPPPRLKDLIRAYPPEALPGAPEPTGQPALVQPDHRPALQGRAKEEVLYPWRIALGGIWHETNTFAAGLTGLDAFRAYQYALGDEMLCRYAGTNTELGGMITATKELGFELVKPPRHKGKADASNGHHGQHTVRAYGASISETCFIKTEKDSGSVTLARRL